MVVSRPPRRSRDGGEGLLRISTLVSRVLSPARLGASPRRWRAVVRPFDERGYLRSSRALAVGKLHDSTARAALGRKPRAFREDTRRGRTELDQRVRRERVAPSRSRGLDGAGTSSDGRGQPADTRHPEDVTRPHGLRALLAGLGTGRPGRERGISTPPTGDRGALSVRGCRGIEPSGVCSRRDSNPRWRVSSTSSTDVSKALYP